LRYYLEESLNAGRAYGPVALPAKVTHIDERLGISVPRGQLEEVDSLLAALRRLNQEARNRGETFEIPSPVRRR
jgi:hypothetical protein